MKKIAITTFWLLITMVIAFGIPKPQYESLNILSQLKIPASLPDWQSTEMASQLKGSGDERYRFISDIFARQYTNIYRESVLFIILDAGNFHHPRACFTNAGFQLHELEDIIFNTPQKKVVAKANLFDKNGEKLLVVYWLTINGKQVDWAKQKIEELWHSLINKKKTGLMVRLDIPVRQGNIDEALKLAQKFVSDLARDLPEQEQHYLFGSPTP